MENFERLTQQEETDLVACSRGGGPDAKAARDRLVLSCYRLVFDVAKPYRRYCRNGDQEDMVEAGFIGLMNAVDRFDPNRGCRLVTYAWRGIYHSIKIWFKVNYSKRRINVQFTPWCDEFPCHEESCLVEKNEEAQRREHDVAWAMSSLSKRDQSIIRRRLMNEEQQTLKEIGAHYHISKERVRQIEQRCINLIKHRLEAKLYGVAHVNT